MLKRVTLENFKRFGSPVTLELASVTLILGPNSVGKSCLFKALRMLAQSWKYPNSIGTLTLEGDRVTLGNFASVIHRNETERPLKITVTDAQDREASFEFHGDGSNVATLRRLTLRLDENDPGRECWVRWGDALGKPRVLLLEFDEVTATISETTLDVDWGDHSEKAPTPEEEEDGGIDQAPSAYGSAREPPAESPAEEELERRSRIRADVRRRISGVFYPIREEIRALAHVGRIRQSCPEYTTIYDADTDDLPIGKSGENLSRILATQSLVRDDLNEALAHLASADPRGQLPRYRVDVNAPEGWQSRRISLQHLDTKGGHVAWTRVTEVGAGIGQIMPILVEWARLRRKASAVRDAESDAKGDVRRVLLLEQPELHLHPAHQTALMSMLAGFRPDDHELCPSWDERPQVIIETHSEHMVMRAQTLVRTRHLGEGEVSILALGVGPHDETTVTRIHLSEDGMFEDAWPTGFFDERFEEMTADLSGKS